MVMACLINTAFATDCTNCSSPKIAPQLISNNELTDLIKLTLKAYCKEPFNKQRWDRITNQGKLDNFTENDYYLYLLRFAKPGGFDKKNKFHVKILESIFSEPEIREKYEKEYIFAYQQVLLTNQDTDGNFHLDLYDMGLSKTIYNDEDSCQNQQEREITRKKSFELAHESVKQYGVDSPLCKFPTEVSLLMPSLVKLDEEKQKDIINPIYRGLGACLTAESSGAIYISKALVFTKNIVKARFGKKGPPLTDVTQYDEQALVISNNPINDDEGVTSAEVYTHKIEIEGDNIAWETSGKKYTAAVKKQAVKLSEHIDSSKAPDYKKMWQDNKLTGMTMVSPNLGEWKDKVTSNYIAYYTDQGFEFSTPVDVKDTHSWLKNSISSGEIDYVLKEAHTGGNDYDLIGLSKTHKIMTGVKKLKDGKQEVMHILMPQEEIDSSRVKYNDMAEWMDKREKDNKGPLLYLNSSCWSTAMAKNEIAHVKSKLFIDIPSVEKTTTFFNSPKSTKYHIMQGIREGKSYAQMLEGMKTTERHQHGYNQYLFPDQTEYHEAMSTSDETEKLTFEIKEDGKSYALHEANQ